MVSKRNQRLLLEKRSDKLEFHYGLRKFTVGVASVLLGTTVFLGGQVVHADTVNSEEANVQVKQPVSSVTDSSAAVSQVAANENQSSASSSVVVNSVQNTSQSVSRVTQPVNQGSAQASSQVDSGADNKAAQSSNAVSSVIEMSLANSSVDFGSSANAAQKFQVLASDTAKPMTSQMIAMAVNDSHYQMNKVVSTGRDLWMAFDVPFVWYQPSQLGNGVLALGDGHHNGELSPWKFQVYTQWHRDSDDGQWQFVSGYTSDPAHYALETSEVKILGSQSQNGHTFTVAALPITVNAYTLKDQLQSGGYYIMVPGLNAQAGLDQLSGSWTASIPVGANGQIPLGRLGVTVSKIQYVTGANHDQVISSVNVHQDIIRNGTAQDVNLSGIPSGYRLEYVQPSLTPVYSGYIPNDTAINHSNCYISINSDGTLTVNVPVTNSNIPDDDNIKVNTAIDVVTDANYAPAVQYLPNGVTLGNPSDTTSDDAWLDSFRYDASTQMIHTAGWHASNKVKNAKYHYIVLWDDTDKVVLAKKAVIANIRSDVQKVHSNEINSLYSGWDTSFAITSPYMQTHTLKVISEYTTDPEGNNVVSSHTFDRTNIDNINQLDINKVDYAANQQVHHLVYLTDQTKRYTTSNTMQKSDFVHSDTGLSQTDKNFLAQPMVIDWNNPHIQNSSTVYTDGRANKTAAFGQKVDVTFDGDTVVYTAHVGEARQYRVIEDLPNGTHKVVYDINALFNRHSDGKYYADILPQGGTYNSSHYSASISPASSSNQVFIGATDPGYAAMTIDDMPGYTWQVVPNASLGNNYSKGLSFNRASAGTKIGSHTCTGNELIFDLLLGMNEYSTIAPSGDIHIQYVGQNQSMTVQFVDADENNKVLFTRDLMGTSDTKPDSTFMTNEYQTLYNQGYVTGHDEETGHGLPTLVFDHDSSNNQIITIALRHGVHVTTFSVPVTRTIHYVGPSGVKLKADTRQSVTFTGTVVTDMVTGDKTMKPDQASQTLSSVDTSLTGYIPDIASIPSLTVTSDSLNSEVTVHYTPKPIERTIIVKYVDDDDNGRVLQTDTLKGYEAITSTYTTAQELGILRNQHYVLVSDETNGKPLVFGTDNNKDHVYMVHLKHETEEEAITSMTVNGKIFYANTPGNLAKVPSDQMPSTQNISPISYSAFDGLGFSISRDLVTHRWRIDQVVSSIPCGRLKQVDGFWLVPVVSSSPLIDQHFWGSSWQMAETDLAELTGSGDSGSESVLGADIKVDLAEDTSSSMWSSLAATVIVNFHFQYMPKAESAKITYVDDTTGNTLKTEEIAADYNTYVGMDTPGGPDVLRAANGYGSKIQFKSDPAAQIKLYQDQGYQLVSSNFTEGATFKDGDDANVFTVHLAHSVTPVKPSKPINSDQTTSGGRPINGAHASDLNKTVTRTIILKTPGQTDQRIVQTVNLTRSASVDEVTGKVTYGTWSTGAWPDYHVPVKVNYTADETMIASQIVDDTTVDKTITVSYSLNKPATQYTITVKYVDDDNNGALVGKAVTVSGNDVDFKLSIPDNYGLVVGQAFPTKVDASVDGKSYVVHLCHLKQVVSRKKPVKRVINYVDEQGHSLHQSVTQDAGMVIEYGNKDLVTGDVVWGQYHVADGSANAFGEYSLPQYKGFTSFVNGVKSTVIPKAYVTYSANGKPVQLNTTVEVTYQPDGDLSNPGQPETDSESNDDQSGDTLTARRTILIYEPIGAGSTVFQTIQFVKDHDQKILAAVTNPQIAGYYTSSQQVDGVTVDYENADNLVKIVNVVYHLALESLHIHFYDVDGNLIQSANVNGKYGQTIDVHSVLPVGWQLYAGQAVPDLVKLGAYNADLAFVLDHKIAEIKPAMNVSTTDVIPGTNHLTYPSEVLSFNLNRDLVYTVSVTYPDGKVEPKVFKQHVSRSAYLDLVTGKVIGYSKWTNNGQHTFNAFVLRPKDGYMIDPLPAVTLDVDHPTETVDVSYVPKAANGQVVYMTFAGQKVNTQNFVGNQLVNFVVPAGYRLATNVASLQPTSEAGQKYIVYVIPQVMAYTSYDDNKPTNIGDLTKIVTRTIHITEANGHVRTIKQSVHFTRTATVEAGGSIEYSNWQAIGRAVMNKVFLPKRHGYHLVITDASGKALADVEKVNNVTSEMNDEVVSVKYVKD